MKKLRSILCVALMLAFGGLALVGCGPTQTTITLEEAKTIIVNALALEETQAQTLDTSTKSASHNDNRNIFAKLYNSQISFESGMDAQGNFSGVVQKTLTTWTMYSMESASLKEYYDGTNVYQKGNSALEKTTFESSYFRIYLQSLDCIYVDLLFIDNAWISIYESTATKTSVDYGYTLTMNVNMSRYVDFVMAECEERDISTEGLFGDGEYRQKNKDEGRVDLVLKFDKNFNILGMDFLIKSLCYNGESLDFYDSKISISKYNQKITAPEWFNQ